MPFRARIITLKAPGNRLLSASATGFPGPGPASGRGRSRRARASRIAPADRERVQA
jgi:hypothetical protein